MTQMTAWVRHPEAEALILKTVENFAARSPVIAKLQEDLYKHTSTQILDFLDHIILVSTPDKEEAIIQAGFVEESASVKYRVFFHPGAQLPRIVLKDPESCQEGIALKVESISSFLMIKAHGGWIEGTPYSHYRRAHVEAKGEVGLWVVERRATHVMEPTYPGAGFAEMYLEAKEKWMCRPRQTDQDLDHAIVLAGELGSLLGKDLAAWIVMECEREFWEAKNTAGQIQKNRQDSLGLGWANHDHHTFRSSRALFTKLVRLFEVLGFHCRERFYAGKEAGWGAQVMENPRAQLVLFLDLDLEPHEIEIDFAHQHIPETSKLGTIGLWCALHGDSILQSGMHHLEAQFCFEALKQDLEKMGISMMDPFSNFEYLKQAFTHGQVWHVDPTRVNTLLKEGKITPTQAEKFIKYGAVGSHLENLQRKEGYKGFNQKNVSYIIQKTDPRHLYQE
jgi:hypothetical protein